MPSAAHWRASSTQSRFGPMWCSLATLNNITVGPTTAPGTSVVIANSPNGPSAVGVSTISRPSGRVPTTMLPAGAGGSIATVAAAAPPANHATT